MPIGLGNSPTRNGDVIKSNSGLNVVMGATIDKSEALMALKKARMRWYLKTRWQLQHTKNYLLKLEYR